VKGDHTKRAQRWPAWSGPDPIPVPQGVELMQRGGNQLNLADAGPAAKSSYESNPIWVIKRWGYTGSSRANQNQTWPSAVNASGTGAFAEPSLKLAEELLQVSTNSIWRPKAIPMKPAKAMQPLGVYGKTKGGR